MAIAPVWSGNWKIDLTPTGAGTRIAAGLSDYKFGHQLPPGGRFEAPAVLVALGLDGAGAEKRQLPAGLEPDAIYRFQPRNLEPAPPELRTGIEWMSMGLAFGGSSSIAGVLARA